MPKQERADAARNRQAVLEAAERLLAERGHVSLDEVAAEAGVGKGTVFRRFGNRAGLIREILAERSRALREAVTSGPPPLGPGAPSRERLMAFLAELTGIGEQNASLLSAHEAACADHKHEDPSYRFWAQHIADLITAERPDLDADFLSHAILATFDADLIRHMRTRGPGAFTSAVQAMVTAILDAPRKQQDPSFN
ncbi:transcriptional regulator, TetR family [Saccharopolyspora shandongensis]|uniref:Transcriptional regulator, TetR family n=1 Tax=Saccharopolyspora shandongensis TaxID=418495 RepID=A0A1H2YZU9_9PSEU|nr:TetR/AcrR family transcriptional regulator [Saccharopolyspora shandongensis]SDX10278.1 transcriptional regulator, TetR family [Saccharopolyspora shandongensis]